MVKHKLTKEPDVFLGEKVIEVRRVGAPRDVWYKLGKCGMVTMHIIFFRGYVIGLYVCLSVIAKKIAKSRDIHR